MTTKTYDSKCLYLADCFLEGREASEQDYVDLAQTIQDAIEDWFFDHPEAKPKSSAATAIGNRRA